MSNVKITELTAETNPVSTDVLPIVDVTADETKKITIADLLKNAGSGSAAAPGISFDEDSDTGIYRAGPNALGFATGGVGRFFIDSSGSVGIHNTSPSLFSVGNRQLVVGSGSASQGITIYSGPSATGTLAFNDVASSSNRGLLRYAHYDDSMGIYTAASEAVHIDSSGNVNIGGTLPYSPNIELHADGTTEHLAPIVTGITESNVNTKVSHSFLYPAQNVTGGEGVVVALGMAGRGRVYAAAEHPGTSKDSINLGLYAGHGTTLKKVADFGSNGTVQIPGPLTIGGTAAANTIDEYEVGTFTPAITSSTSPTQNYTTQTGDYVKIGDLVYVRVTVKFGTGITAGSGNLVCSLPFSADTYAGGTIMIAKSWVSDTPVMIQTQSGNASCALKRNLTNDGVDASNVQNNTEIHFSIVYQVR